MLHRPRSLRAIVRGLGLLVGLSPACGGSTTAVRRQVAAAPVATPAPRPLPVGDADRDGVNDAYDACPTLPGVRSTVVVLNGCPPPGYYDDGLGPHDRDGDGILDDVDACAEDPGVASTASGANGCPAPPDQDGDGLVDAADACPTDAGPAREEAAWTGCPLARVDGDLVRIQEPIRFASGSAELLPESEPVLAAVATLLVAHPELTRVEVEGHTDARGGAETNRALGLRRAEQVVRWLSAHTVDAGRLSPRGLGADRPIDTNDTEDGRATNRRVELHVVERRATGSPVDASN
jgi:OmpA-OmpF porin, OOP family